MAVQITGIDDTPLGLEVGLEVGILLRNRTAHASAVNMRPRPYHHPSREGASLIEKERILTVWRAPTVRHDEVMAIFRPRRELRRLHGVFPTPDGDVDVYLDGDVTAIDFDVEDQDVTYTVTFVAETGYWLSATEHTSADGTATPAGNLEALPRITLTGGEAVTRRRYTVLDNTGHGLRGFLWKLNYPDGTADATDYDVYLNRRRVPFAVSGAGEIWLRIDVAPRRSDLATQPTIIDVYHAPGLGNNVSADLLKPNGIDFAASTNEQIVHSTLAIAQNSGSATGVLRPALQGEITNSGAVMVRQSASEVVFQINTRGERVANAIEVLNGVGFGAGVSISGLTREYASQSGFHLRYFVRYMDRSGIWQTYEDDTTTDSGSASGNINLPSDAIQCVIGIDADPSRAHLDDESEAAGSLTLSKTVTTVPGDGDGDGDGTGETVVSDIVTSRNPADLPTVAVSEAIPARHIHGSLSVQPSGERVYLEHLYIDDDAAWWMDCLTREIDVDTGARYLGDIRRSNPHEWVRFMPAVENTVSAPDGVQVTLSWRDRWIDD